MKRANSPFPAVLATLAVMGVAGYFGWSYLQPLRGTAPAPASQVVAPVLPLESAVSEPLAPVDPGPNDTPPAAVEGPVDSIELTDAASAANAPPALADADARVTGALTGLLGRHQVLTFLQLDGFARRVVATVDNLARSHAPSKVWPVVPTPDRFTTQRSSTGAQTIHPDNARRYAPLVQTIEAVDTAAAVKLYRAFYPLFQQAYEAVGFPGRDFNQRMVQVLDHLITTPVPAQPVRVTLVEVKGDVPSLRPWVRYEYADPSLEAQSAGRKILMRTGPDHQRRLQAKMKELRQHIVSP